MYPDEAEVVAPNALRRDCCLSALAQALHLRKAPWRDKVADGLREENAMNNLKNRIVLLLAVALCAVAVHAQSGPMLKATIPVDFVIGERSLPAGVYTVKSFGSNVEGWYDENGRGLLLINTIPMGKEAEPNTAKLVFHRYGETYFLREVWSGGASYEVRAGDREHRMAKLQKPEVVAVLVTR